MDASDRSEIALLKIELSGKLDRILDRLGELKEDSEDHEERLRSVERWKYAIPVTVIGILVAAVMKVVGG